MIYTSYYNNKHLPLDANIIATSCSITPGTKNVLSKFNWKHYTPLSPPWWLVDKYHKGLISEDEYEDVYSVQLLKLDVDKVLLDIGPEAFLLCYEETGLFCHRHIVAKWLRNNNIEIEEFDIKNYDNKIISSGFEF